MDPNPNLFINYKSQDPCLLGSILPKNDVPVSVSHWTIGSRVPRVVYEAGRCRNTRGYIIYICQSTSPTFFSLQFHKCRWDSCPTLGPTRPGLTWGRSPAPQPITSNELLVFFYMQMFCQFCILNFVLYMIAWIHLCSSRTK